MKKDKITAIQALAEVFAQRNRDQFAVLNGRWWWLTGRGGWTQSFAKETAFHALQECAGFISTTSEADRWLLVAMGNISTGNQILARAATLLRVRELPGPGFTPQIPSSEL